MKNERMIGDIDSQARYAARRQVRCACSLTAIVVIALLAGSSLAKASDCANEIKELEDKYQLSGAVRSISPGTGSSGDDTAPPTTADTVPNTGGITDPNATTNGQLPQDKRSGVVRALAQAQTADKAGDGMGCITRVQEARRLAAGANAP